MKRTKIDVREFMHKIEKGERDFRNSILTKGYFAVIGSCENDIDKTTFRSQNFKKEPIDLSDSICNDLEFNRVRIPYLKANNTDFRGCDFYMCELPHMEAKYSDFRGAKFYYTDISHSNLMHSNFGGSILLRSNIIRSNMQSSYFSGANLDAYLESVDLRWSDLCDSELNNTSFVRTNLSDANLRGMEFNGRIDGSRFYNAELDGTTFPGAMICTKSKGRMIVDAYNRPIRYKGLVITDWNRMIREDDDEWIKGLEIKNP